jgi:hypothetical protein
MHFMGMIPLWHDTLCMSLYHITPGDESQLHQGQQQNQHNTKCICSNMYQLKQLQLCHQCH